MPKSLTPTGQCRQALWPKGFRSQRKWLRWCGRAQGHLWSAPRALACFPGASGLHAACTSKHCSSRRKHKLRSNEAKVMVLNHLKEGEKWFQLTEISRCKQADGHFKLYQKVKYIFTLDRLSCHGGTFYWSCLHGPLWSCGHAQEACLPSGHPQSQTSFSLHSVWPAAAAISSLENISTIKHFNIYIKKC